MEYLLGFLDRFVRIPVVGQDGEAEVLAEASRNVIFADVGAEEVDAWEEGLAVFVASDDKVVIERVLFISSLVGNGGEVVCVLLNWVADTIIEQISFSG